MGSKLQPATGKRVRKGVCPGKEGKPTCRHAHSPCWCHLHVAFCSEIVPKAQPLCSRAGAVPAAPPSCCVCVFHIRSFCPKESFIEATHPGLLTAFLATRGFKNLPMDQDSCCSDPSEDCKSLQKNTSPKDSTKFLTHRWKGRTNPAKKTSRTQQVLQIHTQRKATNSQKKCHEFTT